MLAASCSAADAMYPFPTRHGPTQKPSRPRNAPGSGRRRLRLGLAPGPALWLLRLCRRLRLGSCRAAGNEDFPAGRFDGRNSRFRSARHLDRDRGADCALGQQADTVARPAQDMRRHQLLRVEAALGGELAGIERLLQLAEIHDLEVLLKDFVVEAALRQPAMQRGLAALEAVKRDAGARGLALAAASGGLSLAGSDAAADPLGSVVRARIVSDLVELHHLMPQPAISSMLSRRASQASC